MHETYHKANLGDISDTKGNVHIGDNVIEDNTHLLIKVIQNHLDNRDLGTDYRKKFQDWVDILLKPNGASFAKKILIDFANEEAVLKKVAKEKNHKLKIWLDRYEQKEHFIKSLKQFGKYKQFGAFVFCVVGNSENDGIEDATEMLQLHFFNEEQVNSECVKEKRIDKSVSIKTKEDALSAYEDILRDLLNLTSSSEPADFMDKLQNKNVVTRCKVRTWEENGLTSFFEKWLNEINRENKFPFLLILEFSVTDFERLEQLIDANFAKAMVSLLPKLSKVITEDLDEFYAKELQLENEKRRYDTIFDRNSLTSQDTPLFYQEAINKLQLK